MPPASQGRSSCEPSEWRGPGEIEAALHPIACRICPTADFVQQFSSGLGSGGNPILGGFAV